MNRKQRKRKENREKAKSNETNHEASLAEAKSANHNQAADGDHAAERTENLKHETRSSRFKKWFFAITIAEVAGLAFTCGILIATIVYTEYARKQWQVIKQQTDDSELAQRALLTFKGLSPPQQMTYKSGENVYRFFPTWENSGTTEATNVITLVQGQDVPRSELDSKDYRVPPNTAFDVSTFPGHETQPSPQLEVPKSIVEQHSLADTSDSVFVI